MAMRKLGRTSDHRKAMLRAMVTFLLENGKIETTVTRAKEVRSEAEKMITLGKKDDLHSKRQVFAYVTKESVSKKLFDEIAPNYSDRNGGYTRMIKLGTVFEIEHIFAVKRQEKEGLLSNDELLEKLGNKALLEKRINIRASDYRFEDKKKYYVGFTTKKR